MLKWTRNIFITAVLVSFLLACFYGATVGTDTTGANASFICSTWCGLGDPPGGDEEWGDCFQGCLDRVALEAGE